jgi:hypothetical protein
VTLARPYDFQNWTGELFDPAKHMMSEADKERRKRERQKQNPVPTAGTPRPYGRDIEKTGTLSSLCPYGRDIETAPDRPYGRDITSLTSCRGQRGPDEEPIKLTALMEWAPPTLTKIESTEALRRLYRCEMLEDANEEHLRDGDANAPIPARDAQSHAKPNRGWRGRGLCDFPDVPDAAGARRKAAVCVSGVRGCEGFPSLARRTMGLPRPRLPEP